MTSHKSAMHSNPSYLRYLPSLQEVHKEPSLLQVAQYSIDVFKHLLSPSIYDSSKKHSVLHSSELLESK